MYFLLLLEFELPSKETRANKHPDTMGDVVPIHYVVSPIRCALVAFHATTTFPLGCVLVGFSALHYVQYHRHGYGPDSVATPWSLYAMGSVGCVMVYAAATSFRHGFKLTGKKAEQLASLSGTTRSFVISLASQIVLIVLYVLTISEKWDMGGDPSGSIVIISTFVRANLGLVLSFTVTLLAVEALAIAVSAWERWIVLCAMKEADAAEAADLEEVARQAYEPVSASAWNERLREKYGVDPLGQRGVGDEELGRPLLGGTNDTDDAGDVDDA